MEEEEEEGLEALNDECVYRARLVARLGFFAWAFFLPYADRVRVAPWRWLLSAVELLLFFLFMLLGTAVPKVGVC